MEVIPRGGFAVAVCDRGHRMVGGGASEGGDRGWMKGCAKDSTHTGIIDRLKPTGDWKIVVRGVSSGCKSQGLLRPRRCQRNLK